VYFKRSSVARRLPLRIGVKTHDRRESHGDPITETAYFLTTDERTELLLIQGQAIEPTGAWAIVARASGPSTSREHDEPPRSGAADTSDAR
jgi:hypothetical protein